MSNTLKRTTALALALILTVGQLAIPTAAEETITQETLQLPTVTGGEITESVEVTVTTETTGDVTATATATSKDGYVTESNLTVEVQGESTDYGDSKAEDDVVYESELTYKGSNADGSYEFEGGTEVTVQAPDVEDLTADLITTPSTDGETSTEPAIKSTETVTNADGSTTTTVVYEDGKTVETTTITAADGTVTTNTVVTNGEAINETDPTHEGDNLKADNAATYDQTTVVSDPRILEVTTTEITTVTGNPDFVANEGDVVILNDRNEVSAYYTAEEYAALTEKPAGAEVALNGNTLFRDDNGDVVGYVDSDGNVIGFEVKYDGYDLIAARDKSDRQDNYTISWSVKVVDENGVEQTIKVGGGNTRRWTLSEKDEKGNEAAVLDEGMYCVDASITGKPYGEYRMVNIEDAIELGYYGEDEVDHLRAIAAFGFDWDPNKNTAEGRAELDANLEELNQRLRDANIFTKDEGLTNYAEAAALTQMAIWKYGNRYGYESEELIPTLTVPSNSTSQLDLIMKAYDYMISDQCIADLKAKHEENKTPGETQIINQEKFVENISFTVNEKVEGLAENEDGDDTNDIYYTTLKFSMVVAPDEENDDLVIKVLDAAGNVVTQSRIAGALREGETEATKDEDGFYLLNGIQMSENSENTLSLKLEGYQNLAEGVYVFEAVAMTDEQAAEKLGYSLEAWYSLSVSTREGLKRSQNLIGISGGQNSVDVSTSIDLTFNVDEAQVVTTHEWRSEYDPSAQNDDGPIPETTGGGGGGFRMRFIPPAEAAIEVRPARGDTTIIIDEEVPLADAPETGDPTILFGIMGMISLAGSAFLGKKKEEEI